MDMAALVRWPLPLLPTPKPVNPLSSLSCKRSWRGLGSATSGSAIHVWPKVTDAVSEAYP
jgi:hypothetical protein